MSSVDVSLKRLLFETPTPVLAFSFMNTFTMALTGQEYYKGFEKEDVLLSRFLFQRVKVP
jgi:hypothetical protein